MDLRLVGDGKFGELHRLARLYNVQTSYFGVDHRRHAAPPESLLAVLRILGAPVASFGDVTSALRERKLALRRQALEPVNAVTDDRKPEIRLCLPADLAEAGGECRLEMEDGEVREWRWRAGDLPTIENIEVDGERYIVKSLPLPDRPPHGYHHLVIRAGRHSYQTRLISAPSKTYQPPSGEDGRRWGAFLPLYALRTEQDWGSGDYTGLGRLAGYLAGQGGSVVGTLPLLPVFLDKPFQPSPYAPVSRRLWNEFYIDVTRAPGFREHAPSGSLVRSADFQEEVASLKGEPLVDYPRLMALKRRILEELCRYAGEEIERFGRENPTAEGYARFRATMETRQTPWPEWPRRLRDGRLRPGDYSEDIRKYYLYAQWLAARQVDELAAKCRESGVRLYFDLPLGVHPAGYDVWQQRDVFVLEASGGAPPDSVYTLGQDWEFAPLHPENIRQQGYRYVIEYIHHQLRYADMLRIDHIMGLHRLFWVPHGMGTEHGVYVRYRADELYAILAVESHRHRCVIIGEDLGTVPPYVRPAMSRHGVRRMFILQYALIDSAVPAFGRVPPGSLAALNTHDMPPFAAFWQDDDFAVRLKLGLLDVKDAAKEKSFRRSVKKDLVNHLRRMKFLSGASPDSREIIRACLAYLSASRAGLVLVNLEDLWLETEPQNMPSVNERYPNWRHKARYTLEEAFKKKEITGLFEEVYSLRKRGEQ